MSLRSLDAENVLHEALQKGRFVFGVMQNRYSPPSKWLKEVISSDKLGNIYMVHVDCFWNRDDRYYRSGDWHGSKKLDGGTLFTQFSHFIDILYWVFGDIHPTHVDIHNFNHKESIDFEDQREDEALLPPCLKGKRTYCWKSRNPQERHMGILSTWLHDRSKLVG